MQIQLGDINGSILAKEMHVADIEDFVRLASVFLGNVPGGVNPLGGALWPIYFTPG